MVISLLEGEPLTCAGRYLEAKNPILDSLTAFLAAMAFLYEDRDF